MSEKETCQACRRDLRPEELGSRICLACVRKTDRNLAEIVTFYALTENELLPGKTGGGKSPERSIGIRIDALDFLAGYAILDVLESWERYLRETYNLGPFGPASAARTAGKQQTPTALTETVRFLRTWLPQASKDFDAIDDLVTEIRDAHREAERVARQNRAATWRVTCPTLTDSGDCGTLLVVPPDLEETVTCKTCATRWSVDRLLTITANEKSGGVWLDPEACALRLGVSEVTLRRWAREGRIERKAGRYDLTSVRAAVEAITRGA
jgi:hypothetical protein